MFLRVCLCVCAFVRMCASMRHVATVVCGLPWFTTKYEILGSFPDSWFGDKLPIEPCFHLDARDVVVHGTDPAQPADFFRRQV